MKHHRLDCKYDKRQVKVNNSSWIGYSRGILKVGDFFTYSDGDIVKFGRMMGRVKHSPTGESGYIIAQVASSDLQFTMQRWVSPESVKSTVPKEKCKTNIAAFFDGDLNNCN